MSFAEKLDYTIEDILALPEGERAELVNGQIYMMATPNRLHQKISQFLSLNIGNYIVKRGGDCEVYTAPFSVYLYGDDRTYVEPDLSVICDIDKLTDKGCNGAPNFVIEIVSPSSRQMDYMTKLFLYRNAGVELYWIVDPESRRISVYHFSNNTFEAYSFTDSIPVGIYEGFEIDFSTFNP